MLNESHRLLMNHMKRMNDVNKYLKATNRDNSGRNPRVEIIEIFNMNLFMLWKHLINSDKR